MHIDGVPNRTSRPTYLLRESYREGKKVRKRTLANLSALSDEQIETIRAVLAGQSMRPVEQLWQTVRSRPHGAVQAVRLASWEAPRLCRGDSRSLTFKGVHPENSKREPTKAHAEENPDGRV